LAEKGDVPLDETLTYQDAPVRGDVVDADRRQGGVDGALPPADRHPLEGASSVEPHLVPGGPGESPHPAPLARHLARLPLEVHDAPLALKLSPRVAAEGKQVPSRRDPHVADPGGGRRLEEGLANRELDHGAGALPADDGQFAGGRPVGRDDALCHHLRSPASAPNPGKGGLGKGVIRTSPNEKDSKLTGGGYGSQNHVLEPERLEGSARKISLEELLRPPLPCGEDDPTVWGESGTSRERGYGTERHALHGRQRGRDLRRLQRATK